MNIDITEKVLFNYVFFPDVLSPEVAEYLNNSKDFSEEIEFFKELKKSIQSELSFQEKKLLAKKISSYQLNEIIELYPVQTPSKKKENGLILAAASEEQRKPIVSSRTYYDNNKTYIIKVINYENSCKIFVFSTQYELIENFDLIITPQNLKYHIDDNTVPLELDFNVVPESITLELNLVQQS
ncbi:hypothetical protein [Ignavibacterium sp.]|uniref:hypothetical protein n=1 Tax=Ignavibacterium sp. TaxID=2651167 RepID=UPI00307F8F56